MHQIRFRWGSAPVPAGGATAPIFSMAHLLRRLYGVDAPNRKCIDKTSVGKTSGDELFSGRNARYLVYQDSSVHISEQNCVFIFARYRSKKPSYVYNYLRKSIAVVCLVVVGDLISTLIGLGQYLLQSAASDMSPTDLVIHTRPSCAGRSKFCNTSLMMSLESVDAADAAAGTAW